MRFDDKEILATHQEILDWLAWFLIEQTKRGMPKDAKDSLGAAIMTFFASGPEYLKSGKKCEACQGRGHRNLFLLGQDKPTPCAECKGTGRKYD